MTEKDVENLSTDIADGMGRIDPYEEAKVQEDFEKERDWLVKQLIDSGEPEYIKIGEKIKSYDGIEDIEGILSSLIEIQENFEGEVQKQDL